VVVFEEAPRLGGRATAFTDRESGERVDNGQHVLFGCYRETYEYLRCVGTDHLAPLQPRLRVRLVDTGGRSATLTCPPWRPPWHLVGGILRWRAMPFADRLGALRLRGLLAEVRRDGAEAVAARVPGAQTVTDWLVANGQSARLRAWLWEPLAIAALNQSPDVASAAPFVRVLGELFGPGVEDSSIGLPTVPLDELFAEPARRFIEARGGTVHTRSPARLHVDAATGRLTVTAGPARHQPAAVVAAVPWHAMNRIWDGDPPRALEGPIASALATGSSPIVTVNLWFDGPIGSDPFVGLVGGPMHWMFDKQAILAGARHLSVVASGADDLAALDNANITRLALDHLRGALPAARARTLQRSVVVREHRATFSLAPGSPPRPPAATGVPGLFLAGDWTDTGLPGTIEGAVKSGHTAARLVLRDRRG
jgi:squalene-associated FAD-dependent desaturase